MKSALKLMVIAVLLLILNGRVFAQTPTPIPQTTIVPISGGATSQPLVLPEFVSIILSLGSGFAKTFAGLFRPSSNKITVTDMTQEAARMNAVTNNLMPQDLQASITPAPTGAFVASGKFRLCVKNPQTGEMQSAEAGSYYKSDSLADYAGVAQGGDIFSALTGPNDSINTLDYTKVFNTTEVVGETAPCGSTNQATQTDQSSVNSSGDSNFSSTPLSIIGRVTQAILALFTVGQKNGELPVDTYGQTTQVVSHSKEISQKTVGNNSRTNGFINTIFDSIQDPTKGNLDAGTQNTFNYENFSAGSQTIQTALPEMAAVKSGMESALCMWTSDGMPNRPAGDKCNIPVVLAAELNGEKLDCSDVTADEIKSVVYPYSGTVGKLDYEIPFTNTSCRLSTQDHSQKVVLCAVQNRLSTGYPPPGAANWAQYEDSVQNTTGQYMNPLFALSLWLEESGASSTPSWGMGCLFVFGQGTRTKQYSGTGDLGAHLQEQMSCVQGFMQGLQSAGFRRFMCQYSDEERNKGYNCTTFTQNPVFPKNIGFWYATLSQKLGSSCKMK